MDVDGVLEVAAEFLRLFLGQCVARNNYIVIYLVNMNLRRMGRVNKQTFEGLLDVNCFFCTGFEVRDSALRLAECHCALGRNLHHNVSLCNPKDTLVK